MENTDNKPFRLLTDNLSEEQAKKFKDEWLKGINHTWRHPRYEPIIIGVGDIPIIDHMHLISHHPVAFDFQHDKLKAIGKAYNFRIEEGGLFVDWHPTLFGKLQLLKIGLIRRLPRKLKKRLKKQSYNG